MVDFYSVLGVLPSAEQEVIDAAYRALIKKYHPDKGAGEGFKQRAYEINEAYQTLRDPVTRSLYDAVTDHTVGDAPARESSSGSDFVGRGGTPGPVPARVSPGSGERGCDDAFALVRPGLLVLVALLVAIFIFCLGMSASGIWKVVPALFREEGSDTSGLLSLLWLLVIAVTAPAAVVTIRLALKDDKLGN